jgi:hypothetical protein
MNKVLILGVHLTNRLTEASKVQGLFTEYGCNIRTRLGLHRVDDSVCAVGGLVLLEMFGDEAKCQELASKLNAIEGVIVKQMEFECC